MTFLSSLDFRVNGQEGTSSIRASVVTTSRTSMQKSSIHLKAMTESSLSLVITIILVVFVFLSHLLLEPYAIADIFGHFGLQKP